MRMTQDSAGPAVSVSVISGSNDRSSEAWPKKEEAMAAYLSGMMACQASVMAENSETLLLARNTFGVK
jgi:hypothetical protein